MPNNYFRFKQFTINQEKSVFKVGTDGVLLGAYADFAGALRILDIGTGTGLLALMAAQRSDADIVAIEPEENSYSEACDNVKSSKWAERIRVEKTSLQDFISVCKEQFDVIISNPPYFRNSLKNSNEEMSAARHNDNLNSSDILMGAECLLRESGSLQLILPYTEGTLFIAEASDYGLYCNRIIKIKPIPSGEVIRLIVKFERIKKPVQEKFLTIETGTRHSYTEDYKAITKDFYLGF